jgi:hypothetical protein
MMELPLQDVELPVVTGASEFVTSLPEVQTPMFLQLQSLLSKPWSRMGPTQSNEFDIMKSPQSWYMR